jgi:hypothetical protein
MQISKYKQYPNTPFAVEISQIDNGIGKWKSAKVSIYKDTNIIGEYIRNYPALALETFCPFNVGDDWFALYSAHYTATRVLKLSDSGIEDWCGEEPDSYGFCPSEFYVPYVKKIGSSLDEFTHDIYDNEPTDDSAIDYYEKVISSSFLNYGFISGSVWGDDASLKLKFVDLSQILDKKINIIEKFGYLELPNNLKLKECIDFSLADIGKLTIYKQDYFSI